MIALLGVWLAAIASPGPLARRLARSTVIYLKAFGWLIIIFDKAANLLLRALRIDPVEDVDSSATARDLESIVADSRASGDLRGELSFTLDRILEFPEQDVEHAMIPRSRVDTVLTGTPVAPRSNTPRPPAKPIAIDPMRAPTTMAPSRMMRWTTSITARSFG